MKCNTYYDGNGVGQSLVAACELFKKVVDENHFYAQYRLSKMMIKGEGGEENFIEETTLIGKAAKQGNEEAKAYMVTVENLDWVFMKK